MLSKAKSFVEENIDYRSKKIEYYNQLNEIGAHKKFPYNVIKITAHPTYKTLDLLYKEPIYKCGGFDESITVFIY